MRHVVLIGSECTGKTTLAGRLSRHFCTACSAEAVRCHLDRKGSPLTSGDVDAIAHEQIELEDGALGDAERSGCSIVIHDTNLLSTWIYACHYYGDAPDWIDEEIRLRPYDLYLLMDIDVPWKPDGQRDRPDRREEMHKLFVRELRKIQCNFHLISGTPEGRFSKSIELISHLIGE